MSTVTIHAVKVPETDESAFADVPVADGTLYVPAESLEAYKADPIWGQWGTILPILVPDTDLATLPNALYVAPQEVAVGRTATLSLQLKNEVAATGFQCDLVLPQGVTVTTDADGYHDIYLSTERTTSRKTDTFNSALQPDGSIRIMASSTRSSTFSGNEGEVATIQVSIAGDMAEGTYPIVLKNIVISDANANTYKMDRVQTSLTVMDFELGDANADREINVGDFTAIANHIMGNTIPTFSAKAADVNEDGDINVGDLTGVANLILYGQVSPNAPSAVRAMGRNDQESLLSIDDVEVRSGQLFTLGISLASDYRFSGYQFDLTLPQGISVVVEDGLPCAYLSAERTDARHTDYFTSELLVDGRLRVLCASTRGELFQGTEGQIAYVTLRADRDLPAQDMDVLVDNILLSANGGIQPVADVRATLHAADATGITGVGNAASDGILYDLSGRKVGTTPRNQGIYIINGKKYIK